MICPKCNSQQPDSAGFCAHCGAPLRQPDTMPNNPPFGNNIQQPPFPPAPTPMTPQKNNNTLLIIVIAVASVIICALLLYVFIGKSEPSEKDAVTTENPISSDGIEYANPADAGTPTSSYNTGVAASGTQYDWLWERKVTEADLAGKSPDELRILRNAIFAHHGYIFKSADLKEYFSNFSWYQPQYADVNDRLSKLEQQNIAFIKKHEDGGSGSKVSSGGGSDPRWVCNTYLTDADVLAMSKSQRRIYRNAIYAAHGRKFVKADLRQYFNKFSWYNPRYDEIPESWLSSTEKHNIALIKSYE